MMAPAPKKLRVIEFKRVSTEKQDLERQQFDLADNRARYNLDPIRTVELKVSGTQVGTEEDWLRMIADMERPDNDGISLCALDRLFRPGDFRCMMALQTMADNRKVIISAKDGEGLIEPWTRKGRQICYRAVTRAGEELNDLTDRIAGGRRKLHAQNKPMNTSAPYGILYRDKYSRDAEGKSQYFYEDPTPASNGQVRREVVVMIFHWRYELGWRMGTIQAELNRLGILSAGKKTRGGKLKAPGPWSRQTVRQLLANRHYIGEHWEGGKQIAVACPSFVTREVFDGAQEVTKHEKERANGRPPATHLLCGWLFCAYCGRRYTTRTGSNRSPAYMCGNFDYAARKQRCKLNSQVRCHAIEEAVWTLTWDHITNPDLLLRNARAYYDSLPKPTGAAKLEKELARLQIETGKIQRMVKAGAYDEDEGTAEIIANKERMRQIEAELKAAGSVMVLPPAYAVKAACERIRAAGKNLTEFAERRPVLEGLVSFRITYDKGTFEIEGKVPVPASSAQKCNSGFSGTSTSMQYIPFNIRGRVA